MKTELIFAMLPLVAGLAACDDFAAIKDGPSLSGTLEWRMDAGELTKASAEIPDTNDFILTVTGPDGDLLYHGSYGDSPVRLEVSPGTYTLRLMSAEFTAPAFAKPQYGDEQMVYVPAGSSVKACLECTLKNCGIRISRDSNFLDSYPEGLIYVRQGSSRLLYSYTEKRIAYFLPGEVSVILSNGGSEQTLFTRTLKEREILAVKLTTPAAKGAGSMKVVLDTSKTWTALNWTIGQGDNPSQGGEPDAISVADAYKHTGENGVWLYGYIVGGDLSTAGTTVKISGITKATHLAIAGRSSVSAKESCVAVELPSGSVREALNLVSHPDLIGRRVYVQGNLVDSYFGTIGLKGTKDYILK